MSFEVEVVLSQLCRWEWRGSLRTRGRADVRVVASESVEFVGVLVVRCTVQYWNSGCDSMSYS